MNLYTLCQIYPQHFLKLKLLLQKPQSILYQSPSVRPHRTPPEVPRLMGISQGLWVRLKPFVLHLKFEFKKTGKYFHMDSVHVISCTNGKL